MLQRTLSYAWRVGLSHRLGRGMLGFGERIVVDDDTGAGRAERYDNETWDDSLQVFPFAGQTVASWSWAPASAVPTPSGGTGGKPTQVELVYGKTTPQEVQTKPKTFFTLPMAMEQKREEGTFQNAKGDTLFGFVSAKASKPAAVLGDTFTIVSSFDPAPPCLARPSPYFLILSRPRPPLMARARAAGAGRPTGGR